jgi:VanZ family protein
MKEETTSGIWINWIAVITYCMLILVLSSIRSPVSISIVDHSDKLMHFGAFAVLAVLFFRAFSSARRSFNQWKVVCLTFFSSSAFGLVIEINQYFIAHRSAEVMDLVADILGSGAGILFSIMLFSNNRFFKSG